MGHQNILSLERSVFVIIDMQEAFRPVMRDFAEITANIVKFTAGAKALGVPIIVTEQYPQGLKHTVPEILDVLPPKTAIFEKTTFSSCGAGNFRQKLTDLNAAQIIIAGIEAHICVNQTVHALLNTGFQVHLLTECITSRSAQNREIAFQKMLHSGAVQSSVEMALFELTGDAKHEQFKTIQRLTK